jgi:hypothetical protein
MGLLLGLMGLGDKKTGAGEQRAKMEGKAVGIDDNVLESGEGVDNEGVHIEII